MVITDIKKYYALIFDKKGNYLKKIKINRKDSTFKYGNKRYNIILNDVSWFKRKTILFNHYYYFYNINNPMPLNILSNIEPVMDSELYNIMLDTKVAKDLNNLPFSFNMDMLKNPKIIFIIIIIVIAIIYFSTGGQLV